MPTISCGKMKSGCPESGNGFHKCKLKVKLTEKQDKQVRQGGRIDGPKYTDYCKGHQCQFCDSSFK